MNRADATRHVGPLWDGTPEGGADLRASLADEARGVLGVFRLAALARRLGRTEVWTVAALRCFRFAEPHAPAGCSSATWRLMAKGRAEIEDADPAPRPAGGRGAGAGDGPDVCRAGPTDAPGGGATAEGYPGPPGTGTGLCGAEIGSGT